MLPDTVDAGALVRAVSAFLEAHPEAAVLEGGRVLFDLRSARYAVKEAHRRCVLELWSDERNLVRAVVEQKRMAGGGLKILTRKMGAAKPVAMEIIPSSGRRAPGVRDKRRQEYLRLLERVMGRAYPEFEIDALRSAMDLEHSFGPAYVRGILLRGTVAEAVIGVGASEAADVMDGVLALGLLWLDYCREHASGRRHFEGLRVVMPVGCERVVAERMRWLNPVAAKWRLFVLDERAEELREISFEAIQPDADLPIAFDSEAAIARCREGVDRLMGLMLETMRPLVRVVARSVTEVALCLYGLEFARVRISAEDGSFAHRLEVRFGVGTGEMELSGGNEDAARAVMFDLFHTRYPSGDRKKAMFRLRTEEWLAEAFGAQLEEGMPGVREELLHADVLRLRGTVSGLLGVDRDGRLAVFVFAAEELLQLPLLALDAWMRVRALALQRAGYFAGIRLADALPRVRMVAPVLRLHPANEVVLRYMAKDVEWEMLGVGERWREQVKVVHRKRAGMR